MGQGRRGKKQGGRERGEKGRGSRHGERGVDRKLLYLAMYTCMQCPALPSRRVKGAGGKELHRIWARSASRPASTWCRGARSAPWGPVE
eukprot:3595137-Rhodomonas_salina.2